MRRALMTAIGVLELGNDPDPEPGVGEVLVRVEACGICGTDRSIFGGKYPIDVPIVLGHEYSGTVVAIGEGVRTVGVGQRVSVDPNVVCGTCPYCRRGLTHLCERLTPLGIVRPGGYSELSVVPETNAYVMPEDMSMEVGALIEPLSCSVRGIQLAQIQPGDSVVIVGAGPMGCMLLQLAALSGASRVIVSEPKPARQQLARELGASEVLDGGDDVRDQVLDLTGGLGADVSFEAVGNAKTAALALTLVRRGGTVMWFGSCPPPDDVTVNPFWVNDNEITIRGSFNNPFTHAPALALAATGKVRLDPLATDRVALDGLEAALDLGNYPEAGKIIVAPHMEVS